MAGENIAISRRRFALSGIAAAAALTVGRSSFVAHGPARAGAVPPLSPMPPRPAVAAARPSGLDPVLLQGALAALDRHGDRLAHRDRLAVVDFTAASSEPRLHLVNLEGGDARAFLVAHGSGSDPGHTGFLHSFSNTEGSNASSQGAFVTADYYVGKHGRSQRLVGLDPTNSRALERSIVVHGAWYANAEMIPAHGKLGRSQGCFAVGERELAEVFARLGPGRLIYAAKA